MYFRGQWCMKRLGKIGVGTFWSATSETIISEPTNFSSNGFWMLLNYEISCVILNITFVTCTTVCVKQWGSFPVTDKTFIVAMPRKLCFSRPSTTLPPEHIFEMFAGNSVTCSIPFYYHRSSRYNIGLLRSLACHKGTSTCSFLVCLLCIFYLQYSKDRSMTVLAHHLTLLNLRLF